MRSAGLDEAQAGIQMAGRHINPLRYVFPVVMYGCESWTVKKAERQRIGAFELWCWRSGILQARILEWVAIFFSRVSSRPGDQTWVSGIADRFSTV